MFYVTVFKCASNEMKVWKSETPIRQIRIDEDELEEGFGVKDIHVPAINIQSIASDHCEWESSSNQNAACDSKSWEMCMLSEYDVTTNFPSHSYIDSSDHLCSQTNSSSQQQEQLKESNLLETQSNSNDVIFEVLQPALHSIISAEYLKEAGCNFELPTKIAVKQKQSVAFEEKFDEATRDDASGISSSSDRISLLLSSLNTKVHESVNIAQIREVFAKQKRQRSNSDNADDGHIIASLMKELVVRVALELDFMKNEVTSASLCVRQTQHRLLKVISLEEAKKDFGDLTLEELLKGVSNLKPSTAAHNCLRKWPGCGIQVDSRDQQSAANVSLQQERRAPCFDKDGKKFPRISTEMSHDSDMQTNLRKRRWDSADRPNSPRNLPANQKCIAAVEMVLKQSIKSMKGAEETSPAPRTSIL